MNNINPRTQKVVTLGMLCAFSFLVLLITRFPVGVVTYEAKDAVITIGGFLFGPLSSALISIIVSLIEMMVFSGGDYIGLIMDILSTCSFACVAAFVYKRKRTLGGAVIGLAAGTIFSTAVMILWNYLVTPIYQGVPRPAVVAMLIPFFLPFNLIKGGLNAAVTLLLYKPLALALQKAGLVPKTHNRNKHKAIGITLISIALIVTSVILLLVLAGKL